MSNREEAMARSGPRPWLRSSSRRALRRSRRVRRARRASRPHRWRRRGIIAGVLLLIVAVLPVPWLHVTGDDPPGWAWRLDGRLVVDGQVMDPAGRWSWLTVGRPPLIYELVWERITGTDEPPRDMRVGSAGTRPAQSEPFAAAVGLREAGFDLQLGVFVEVAEPTEEQLPETAIITDINGVGLVSRPDLGEALERSKGRLTFTTATGERFTIEGNELPYAHVRVIDLAPQGLEAAIGGEWTRLAPVAWFRSLSLGSSHGMMVSLLTYAHVADPNLAYGRHVAGTGGIRGDSSVVRIGGLPAKAKAARRAGADVLLFPAVQERELEGFDPGSMELVPVETLADAILYLSETRLSDPPEHLEDLPEPDDVEEPEDLQEAEDLQESEDVHEAQVPDADDLQAS